MIHTSSQNHPIRIYSPTILVLSKPEIKVKEQSKWILVAKAIYEVVRAVFKTILGFLLRVATFQMGVFDRGCAPKAILQGYASRKFDFDRVDKSVELLETLGGKRQDIRTPDGKTLDGMLLTYKDFEASAKEHGYEVQEVLAIKTEARGYEFVSKADSAKHKNVLCLRILVAKDKDSLKAKKYDQECLSKMGWDSISVTKDQTAQQVYLLDEQNNSERLPEIQEQCFVRFHSPAISYSFDRKYTAKHLGMKQSVFLFDTRGTYKSQGTPSESGYYLDGIGVVEHLKKQGYKVRDMWVTGFCAGAAVATYLKKKYHYQGINLATENAYNSYKQLVRSQHLGTLGIFAIDAVKDPKLAWVYDIEEDLFNNKKKLSELKYNNGSACVIVKTASDKVVPKGSSDELYRAARKVGNAHLLIHEGFMPKKCGHSDRPLRNPKVWNKYREIIHLRGKS